MIVRPSSVTVGVPVIVSAREALLALITVTPAPAPMIVRFFENASGPEVSVICPAGTLTVSPLAAAAIA